MTLSLSELVIPSSPTQGRRGRGRVLSLWGGTEFVSVGSTAEAETLRLNVLAFVEVAASLDGLEDVEVSEGGREGEWLGPMGWSKL